MKKNSLSVRILAVLLSVAVLSASLFILTLSAEEYIGAVGIVSPESKLGASLSSLTDQEVEARHWNNLAASSSSKEPLKLPIYSSRANIRYTPSAEASSVTPSRLSNLIDGDVLDSNYGNGKNYGGGIALQRNPYYSNSSEVMPKIQIDLGKEIEISEILISWASGAPVKAYNIYASKTRNFSTSYTWFNDYSGKPEHILSVVEEKEAVCNRLITLDAPAVYRYIVIEFREFSDETKDYSGSEWTGVLLTELGVYAKDNALPEYTVDNINDDGFIASNHAENLVIGPFSLTYGSSKDDGALLYDGKTDVSYTVSVESGQKLRLTARLDGIAMVDSFLISTSERCASVSYRIFAGMGEETVFSGENYVAYRKYRAGDSKTSLFKLNEPCLASCIGIQFTSYITVNELEAVIELLEIAVYGDKPEELDVATSLSDATAVNSDKTEARKSENLLGDGYSYIILSDGCKLQNTDSKSVDFPRSLDMLYDGDALSNSFDGSEKGGALEFKGTGAPYRITLDMGYVPVEINELLIYGLENKEIGDYHLYFSNDADTLFSAESWVGYYKNTDSSFAQLVRFKQSHKEQFVGIEITNTGADNKVFYLKEIAVYGVREFSDIPQPVYTYEVKEDIVNQAYVKENHAYNLIRYARSSNTFDNGEQYTVQSFGSTVTDGTVYDNTAYTWWSTAEYNVCRATYSLGQTVPIDRIMFASNYNSEKDYTTFIYEIYISESSENLYSPEHLAVYWNNYGRWKAGGNKTKGITYGASQVYEFKERPMGRYIGFRIISPNMVDDDNSIRIEQLGVFSNGVSPVDPLYSAVLKDEKTGAEVAVRKLEYEDEYKDIKSVILEPFEIPSETVIAAENYYLKSIRTAYRILLKNAAGKVITEEDLGGRSIEFTIPYSHSDSDGKLYICQMNGGEIVRLEAMVLEDSVNFITYSLDSIGFFVDTFGHGFADSTSFAWDLVYELSVKAAENKTDDVLLGDIPNEDFFFISDDSQAETNTSVVTNRVPKKVKTKRTVVVNNPSLLTKPWFWLAVALPVILAAATIFIILKRKKRKNNA